MNFYDPEDDGMLSMSIWEHLEELRSRILRAAAGLGVAYLLCVTYAIPLWEWVQVPLTTAAAQVGAKVVTNDVT
ncbi:MAG: twin-arginine translocase subunit TatC, partial [Acidobacteriota bacterium]